MHFVIMGCGRVGSALALALEKQGQDVAIIDREAASFRRLGPDFDGRRVTGIGFDRDTLVQAGIENAYAFAAVSSGDNSNILAA
ncbi:MAG: TrkA family potassium uptake protein, partial [Austwickia sp.]|nr:TrkA family potassium uptake protein [Austwickia sp.]